MSITAAWTLFLVMLPLAAIPSSSVALVVARSVSGGRWHGAFCALGIVVGDLIFVAVALFGTHLLAGWLGTLFAVVKYLAGAYLIWLGWRLFATRSSVSIQAAAGAPSSLIGDFFAGLVLTLGDVKAILFYASIFPVLVDMEHLGGWDLALIAAITLVSVGGVKLAYVIAAALIVDAAGARMATEVPRRLGGVLLIGCGAALITKA